MSLYGNPLFKCYCYDCTPFQMQNAKVDHSKAIKEYSGSAADKVGDLEFWVCDWARQKLFVFLPDAGGAPPTWTSTYRCAADDNGLPSYHGDGHGWRSTGWLVWFCLEQDKSHQKGIIPNVWNLGPAVISNEHWLSCSGYYIATFEHLWMCRADRKVCKVM